MATDDASATVEITEFTMEDVSDPPVVTEVEALLSDEAGLGSTADFIASARSTVVGGRVLRDRGVVKKPFDEYMERFGRAAAAEAERAARRVDLVKACAYFGAALAEAVPLDAIAPDRVEATYAALAARVVAEHANRVAAGLPDVDADVLEAAQAATMGDDVVVEADEGESEEESEDETPDSDDEDAIVSDDDDVSRAPSPKVKKVEASGEDSESEEEDEDDVSIASGEEESAGEKEGA